MPELEERSPNGELFRIGRCPDVWIPRPIRADKDPPYRFDDPQKTYLVLYAASQRLGCFLETLADFRPPIGDEAAIRADLAAIKGPDDHVPIGYVSVRWSEERCVGQASCGERFADIYAAHWISFLSTALAAQARELGIKYLDAAVLQREQPRKLTQAASAEVKRKGYSGIYYRSRFGHNIDNWAIFEPFAGLNPANRWNPTIDIHDRDFQDALKVHKLGIYDGVNQQVIQPPPPQEDNR